MLVAEKFSSPDFLIRARSTKATQIEYDGKRVSEMSRHELVDLVKRLNLLVAELEVMGLVI